MPLSLNRRLWTQWVVASALGGLVFAFVVRLVSTGAGGSVGESLGAMAAEVVIGASALGAIMLGIATGQWAVIRGRVAWAGSMWLATVAGGVLAGAAAFGVLAGLTDSVGPAIAVAAAVVLGLVAFGTTQWLGIRGRIDQAWGYSAAAMAGLVAAVVATGVSGVLMGEFAGTGLGGGIFGAAYGVVTGRTPIAVALGAESLQETP